MSTACHRRTRCSISRAHLPSVHGSAPKMPTSIGQSSPGRSPVGRPSRRRSLRKYDGVTMMTRSERKSWISCTCRVRSCPPDIGIDGRSRAAPITVVRAEPTGEQPVAVGDVQQVAGADCPPARRRSNAPSPRPRCRCRRGRVADHRRLARSCPTRRGSARSCSRGYGEHAERVVVAQVRLCGERENATRSSSVAQVVGDAHRPPRTERR